MIKKIFLLLLLCIIPNILNAKVELNKQQPITITSETTIIYRDKQEIHFLKNVEAKQAKFKLYSDRMIAKYKENEDKKLNIESIKTESNVKFITDKIVAKGDIGFYDLEKNIVILKNNVHITENNLTLMADKFEYFVETGETRITGNKEQNEKVTIILDSDKK
ncbi:MAG: LptA/OstA family protein [Rickettsiales bacterium]|nr:LptA/OstA family protein [Rickettsiales bacterium]